MSLDALAYGSHGRTGRFGVPDILSYGMWGKIPKVLVLGIALGVTLNVDSEVLRVVDIGSGICRDFLIIARTDDGTNLLAQELTSEVIRIMDLNTEVVRTLDIESIVELDDNLLDELTIESFVIRNIDIDSELT